MVDQDTQNCKHLVCLHGTRAQHFKPLISHASRLVENGQQVHQFEAHATVPDQAQYGPLTVKTGVRKTIKRPANTL